MCEICTAFYQGSNQIIYFFKDYKNELSPNLKMIYFLMVIQQTLVQDLQQARRYTGKAEYKMLSTTRPAC